MDMRDVLAGVCIGTCFLVGYAMGARDGRTQALNAHAPRQPYDLVDTRTHTVVLRGYARSNEVVYIAPQWRHRLYTTAPVVVREGKRETAWLGAGR